MSGSLKVARSLGKLNPNSTALFLCDMQEKFRSNIKYFEEVVQISNRLLNAFQVLSLPVVCTEQYPKGLGKTVPELEVEKFGIQPIDKTLFSMCSDVTKKIIDEKQVKSVILCGIEAHVCVQNTALDLLEMGIDVHIPADAVSSRSLVDRMFAIQRMRDVGAFITTSESVVLGLAGGSHHPKFKELQKIIWTSAPDTGLLTQKL